jgi:hypothetical protein
MATVELGRMAEEEVERQAAVTPAALAAEVAPLVSMVAVVVMVALAAAVECLVAKAQSSAGMLVIALRATIVPAAVVAH